MKTRSFREKIQVNGTKPEKDVMKKDKKGLKQENRSGKRSPILPPKNRSKRSGVDAVKLHIQATGGTGRTSRSATAVIITILYNFTFIKTAIILIFINIFHFT